MEVNEYAASLRVYFDETDSLRAEVALNAIAEFLRGANVSVYIDSHTELTVANTDGSSFPNIVEAA